MNDCPTCAYRTTCNQRYRGQDCKYWKGETMSDTNDRDYLDADKRARDIDALRDKADFAPMSDIQPTEADREEALSLLTDFFAAGPGDAPVDSVVASIARIRADAVKAERERQAAVFRIAANAIYFDDSSDYQSALYEIIEALKPGYEPDRMPFCETVDDALAILSDDHEARNG
jgi:hypothetical protein